MALSGGSTTAYRCFLDKGAFPVKLVTVPATSLRSECLKAGEALQLLNDGLFAVVAGSEMVELRKMLFGEGA